MSTPAPAPRPALAELVDLTGRTAIVTGGSMGIGRAIAERLHEAGAAVVIADLDAETGAALAAELETRRPGSAIAIGIDVGRRADAARMVDAAVTRFGALDVLVNNAGIYPMAPFLDADPELVERVIRVNLLGVVHAMQAAARQMVAQGRGGRIINVTSVDALHPSTVGLAHYDASKHGVWGLTKNVALELAEHGIAVNALAPGAVATPGTAGAGVDAAAVRATAQRIPMRRMADADEIGRVALFLACDLASYLTGSQIVADGGLLLR